MIKSKQKMLIAAAVLSFSAAAAIALLSNRSKPKLRLDDYTIPTEYKNWQRKLAYSPIPHLVLSHQNKSKVRYIFNSADCGIVKHGYKNRVEIFVIFNQNGNIEQVTLGKNIETPGIIAKMKKQNFFQQWNGGNKYIEPEHVTGATMTGKAVSENLAALMRILVRENFFHPDR